jgi:hypothetical protein
VETRAPVVNNKSALAGNQLKNAVATCQAQPP